MTTVVLLAHGSPDPRSGEAARTAAAEVGARLPGHDVVAAFLDHDTPRLADALHRPTAGAGTTRHDRDAGTPPTDGTSTTLLDPDADSTEVVVLPLLLSSAYHARVDVPAAVAELGADVQLLPPLGHPPAVLDAVLAAAGAPVVVVAAGTRDDEERAAFAEAVAASSARTGVPAYAAFATGPGPRIADLLVPGAVVVPWLLAPGRLLDAVRAETWGHEVLGDGQGLLARPDLIDTIAARLTTPAAFD